MTIARDNLKQLLKNFRTLAVVVAAAAAVAPGAAAQGVANDGGAAMDRSAVERIVRDYILKNPEIVMEAIQALRDRERMAEAENDRQALASLADRIFRDPASPVGGNPDGDVTVVEFFDYRCGVCKRVHPIVKELVAGDPKIRRVYKEWPILGPNSVIASRAALASRRQGDDRYFAFHDAMMVAKSGLEEPAILQIAKSVGLDLARLQKDMRDPEIEAIIRRNYELAEALNLNGTPSFLIGDRIIRGGQDLESMRKLVADARKAK